MIHITFKIAVCDDVIEVCDMVKEMLIGFSREGRLPSIVVETYTSGELLSEDVRKGQVHNLYILDIDLKTITGVAIGAFLRKELGMGIQILYISGKREFEWELFDTQPLNFLIKPIDGEKMLACVNKALSITGVENPCFEHRLKKQLIKISYLEIRYFESRNKKVIIHTLKEPVEIKTTLSEIESTVPDYYVRISQSFLVNYNYVNRVGYGQFILDNGTILTIGPTYRKKVQTWIFTDSKRR